ncbi:MAG: hypothetical protein JOZ69_13075 [Myxococcales bacterium]|nr:hypothetical protein [Myxococcales bacterium]
MTPADGDGSRGPAGLPRAALPVLVRGAVIAAGMALFAVHASLYRDWIIDDAGISFAGSRFPRSCRGSIASRRARAGSAKGRRRRSGVTLRKSRIDGPGLRRTVDVT